MSEVNNNGNETEQQATVTFTPEQQAKLDEIIRNAMGRAAAETRQQLAEAQKALEATQAELSTLKASGNGGGNADVELRDRVVSLTQERDAAAKAKAAAEERIVSLQKQNLIAQHAASHEFVDLGAVEAMTQRNLKWNQHTNRFDVVNEDGSTKLSATTFEPMTPAEFFSGFAAERPYLVKSGARGGNGSTASSQSTLPSSRGQYHAEDIFGKGSNAIAANKLAQNNPTEYKRLKSLAIKRRLI